jgi:hypothetical protein
MSTLRGVHELKWVPKKVLNPIRSFLNSRSRMFIELLELLSLNQTQAPFKMAECTAWRQSLHIIHLPVSRNFDVGIHNVMRSF